MRVLVGCEESQAITKAFRELGHEAYSCDIKECSGGHPEWHIQDDVINTIVAPLNNDPWDVIILHPPCTALAVSGNAWYGTGMEKNNERDEAIEWTTNLWNIAKQYALVGVALENPVGVLTHHLGKPQYIQPWQFGHKEQKKTGLWLHNLPELVETDNVYAEMMELPKKERERLHYMSPSADRGKLRSKTFPGIARAIADQWSDDVLVVNEQLKLTEV